MSRSGRAFPFQRLPAPYTSHRVARVAASLVFAPDRVFDEFMKVIRSMEQFWLEIVRLP